MGFSVQTIELTFEKIFNLPKCTPIIYDGWVSGIDNRGTTSASSQWNRTCVLLAHRANRTHVRFHEILGEQMFVPMYEKWDLSIDRSQNEFEGG